MRNSFLDKLEDIPAVGLVNVCKTKTKGLSRLYIYYCPYHTDSDKVGAWIRNIVDRYKSLSISKLCDNGDYFCLDLLESIKIKG